MPESKRLIVAPVRLRLQLTGITQGVGFRPWLFRLANTHRLTGWVRNESAGLVCEIQGPKQRVDRFLESLHEDAPPLARLKSIHTTEVSVRRNDGQFVILASHREPLSSSPVAPDVAVCRDCLRELNDPINRRFRYPFINCTNCGPRFTIIEDIPYDRSRTTMQSFQMCPQCQSEYDDPNDRRFHAQPNACPDCGPRIWFVEREHIAGQLTAPDRGTERSQDPLASASTALRRGDIVAVKGIGGFHLVCDARNRHCVDTLRSRKGRNEKPLAIMASNVDQVRQFAACDSFEQSCLQSHEGPIVLLDKLRGSKFDEMLESVAPGNGSVGVMLPYSPLHHLLVQDNSPLVVTSGNRSDEPIARTNEEAAARLITLADSFLLHDREIHVVCDDSVVRSVGDRVTPIRRSRGYAPAPIRLSTDGPNVLAIGGEMKSAFCVTKADNAFMSQHIGELQSIETLEALRQQIAHFLRLFRVKVDAVVGDLHPDYHSTRVGRQVAQSLGVPFLQIQHHVAHAAALIAEQAERLTEPILICCFDGTGFGTDGGIWGGEFFVVRDQNHNRVAHLAPFLLPGGDVSIERPYRTALALIRKIGMDWDDRMACVQACSAYERRLLHQQIDQQINCVPTSSMGRLFDGIASLMGLRQRVNYEAQAAIELQTLASQAVDTHDLDAYRFDFVRQRRWIVEYDGVLRSVLRDVHKGVDRTLIAFRFHHAVARMIADVGDRVRQTNGIQRVGLTGGVFQNDLLTQLTVTALRDQGFQVVTHHSVPPNDGGLALGQAVVGRHLIGSGQFEVQEIPD